jgi:hypothetical protein
MKSMRTEMIERYLRARGRRYFRGHHDGEYFFILAVGHERLHVHMEIPPSDRDSVTVRVTPTSFFPAADVARLSTFADKWNEESRQTRAVVYQSCDPNRIGVAAENSYPLAPNVPFEEFADLADGMLGSAVALFAEMATATQAAAHRRRGLTQNAASGSRMTSSSMDSMMVRTAVRLGSMFLAKNAAVAILPR